MAKLVGHVDRADQFLLAGWAIAEDDAAHRPEVRVVQQNRVVLSLRPAFAAPNLRSALKLPASSHPPIYAWRLWLPLSNGVRPNVPFSVVFAEDARPLGRGSERLIDLYANMDGEAGSDIRDETLAFPSFVIDGEKIRIWCRAAAKPTPAPPSTLSLNVGEVSMPLQLTRDLFVFDKPVYFGQQEFALREMFGDSVPSVTVALPLDEEEPARAREHNALRRLVLPRTLIDEAARVAPVPNRENIHRVSGPASDEHQYLAGGLTTFLQLNAMTLRYFGKPITEFASVVDWGAGCARVMRQFFEAQAVGGPRANRSQRILGLDIDVKNVDWCSANMNGLGEYQVLGFDGFRIDAKSVDLVYGISVLTHLSEFHQHLWLNEIARILKPGGCAILTTHGEYVIYGEYSANNTVGIFTPFVDKFGFFDGIPDAALGAELETYYRATYHSRPYIRSNWARYLEILDFVPAANAFRQDFVVLRKR